VPYVARTRIFARPTQSNRQVVVYQLAMEANEAVAMILPLPFKAGADPREFRFISLSGYPRFFADLKSGFPEFRMSPELARRYGAIPAKAAPLEVFQVGSFEASFVPTLADFDRLDERFRIAPETWRQRPGYDRMGFAVFKLKEGRREVHPMGFHFPRADVSRLFFPTLHIHDGTVHPQEHFDHELYAQGNEAQIPAVQGWEESRGWASQFMKTDLTNGILHNEAHVYRRRMNGMLKNEDTLVALE